MSNKKLLKTGIEHAVPAWKDSILPIETLHYVSKRNPLQTLRYVVCRKCERIADDVGFTHRTMQHPASPRKSLPSLAVEPTILSVIVMSQEH